MGHTTRRLLPTIYSMLELAVGEVLEVVVLLRDVVPAGGPCDRVRLAVGVVGPGAVVVSAVAQLVILSGRQALHRASFRVRFHRRCLCRLGSPPQAITILAGELCRCVVPLDERHFTPPISETAVF